MRAPSTPATPPPSASAPAGDSARLAQILGALTLPEKCELLYGATYMDLHAFPKAGVPQFKLADGPLGIRWEKSTAFPCPLLMGATWDVDLVNRVGVAYGEEWRNKGRHVWLGPCINIIRIPMGGRNFETFGEDPWLNGRMATAIIRGAQSQHVVACVKHYACNNQEYDRFNVNVQVDERTLREIYLPAFRAAVQEGGAWAVMSAYNRINGPYATDNEILQQKILKDEWGFRGFVVSDWGAMHDTVGPALHGCDLEFDLENPVGKFWGQGKLLEAVKAGKVPETLIDDKVRRILRAMEFTGVLDQEWPTPGKELTEHNALTREVARAGIVLLKNDRNVLPIDKTRVKTVAVIGPQARVARGGGGGSSVITPYYAVTPAEGLRAAAGDKVKVVVEPGLFSPDAPLDAVDASWLTPAVGEGRGLTGEYFANKNLAGAAKLTRRDVTVDFRWGLGAPAEGLPADGFSVRWSGALTVPKSGEYDVCMASDDGCRVFIDGQRVIDDWNDHAVKLNKVTLKLDAPQPHKLVIEYYDNAQDATAVFSVLPKGVSLADKAVAAAQAADAAIVCVGLAPNLESEGFDRPSMDLDAEQLDLIRKVVAVNPNTIVVVIAGSQVGLGDALAQVPALVQAWYPGQEGGAALGEILFGDVNPSGKLPMTFIQRWPDSPAVDNYPGGVYTEGLYVGYRHFDKHDVAPLFPFGHGLSYTKFEYSELKADAPTKDGKVVVHVAVKNVGARPGAEVVQLYVHDVESSVERPAKELKAFAKVQLAAGESKNVTLELDERAFAFWDVQQHAFRVEPGQFELLVGASSRDIRLKQTIAYGAR